MNQNIDIFAGPLGLAALVSMAVILVITTVVVLFAFGEFVPTPTTPYPPTSNYNPNPVEPEYNRSEIFITEDYRVNAYHPDNPCFAFESPSFIIMDSNEFCSAYLERELEMGWIITSTSPSRIYLIRSIID